MTEAQISILWLFPLFAVISAMCLALFRSYYMCGYFEGLYQSQARYNEWLGSLLEKSFKPACSSDGDSSEV